MAKMCVIPAHPFSVGHRPLAISFSVALLLLFKVAAPAADFSLAQDVSGFGSGTSSGGPYCLTDIAGQPCVGAAGSATYNLEPGFWPTLGSPPVPGAITLMTRTPAATISIEEILSRAKDPDGDSFQIDTLTPLSGRGGTLVLTSNFVLYTAPAGLTGLDDFSYTLVDAGGDVAAGSVTLLIGPAEGASPRVVYGPIVSNGVFVVRYAGVPGLTYTVECTQSLAPAIWRKDINVTAPEVSGSFGPGVFELREVVATPAARFFRTVYPSY